MAIVGPNIKAKLWDAVPRGQMKSVLFRASQQNATIFITFYLIRNFELTTVSMVNNSSTIVTIALSYLILGEKNVHWRTLIALAIGLIATILFITGQKSTHLSEEQQGIAAAGVNSIPTVETISKEARGGVLGLILLGLNPFVIGTGQIAMRRMKEIKSPSLISAYMNVMLLVLMVTIVHATGSDLSLWRAFGPIEWAAIAGLALANVASQTFRFMASQRSTLAPLQPLSFSQTVF